MTEPDAPDLYGEVRAQVARDHHFTPIPLYDAAGENPVWTAWCSHRAGQESVCGLRANAHVERAHRFVGGPWDGRVTYRPRVFSGPANVMPSGDTASIGASADAWPGRARYISSATDPDGDTVVMQWRLPTDAELARAVADRESREEERAFEAHLDALGEDHDGG